MVNAGLTAACLYVQCYTMAIPDLTAASLYVLCYTMGLDPEMILCNCKLVVLVLGTVLVSELGEGLGALQHRPLGGGAFVAG